MGVRLIESEQALDNYFSDIGNKTLLAVDTEFFRETTYFAKLGLVQLAAGEHIACVDVLAFDARTQLAKFLLDPDISKIFHSCLQDLEVLYQYLGAIPSPLLDTQIAAAYLDTVDQIGYAGLVEKKLGVVLDKSQTRTNWLQRPLSSKQLVYAADDVRYLEPLYQVLFIELEQHGRTGWFMEDCAALSQSHRRFEPDFDYCWKRVRGTHHMNGQQLAIVDSVARWRETIAIASNLTRRKVLSDEILVQFAISPPATMSDLAGLKTLPRIIVQQYLEELFAAIQRGKDASPETWPESQSKRPDAMYKSLLKHLQALVNSRADSLGIAPSMLCSRKDLEKLIAGENSLNVLGGWRRPFLGNELLAALGDDPDFYTKQVK